MEKPRTYLCVLGDLAGRVRKTGMRRGFTLTEMAIVVIIIGVVASSIFTAASTVQYHNQLNQGLAEINMIVSNMRSLYASQNVSLVGNTTFVASTPTLISQLVFPSEMLTPPLPTTGIPAAGTVANTQWATGGSAQIKLVAAAAPSPAQFVLRFVGLPPDVCVDLLVHNSLPGLDTGLQQIQVDSVPVGVVGVALTPLPITPIVAQQVCPNGATHIIDWYYSLGS